VWLLVTGLLLTIVWVYLGIDLGPGAPVEYTLPASE
jgi:aminobenzoyl-glutamate transport protein